MPRRLSILVFVAIALSIVALVHYYLWLRLVRDLDLPAGAHDVLSALIVALGASVPATFVLTRLWGNAGRKLSAGYLWMGLSFLLVVVLGAVDLTRLAAEALQRLAADVPEQAGVSAASSRVTAAGAVAAALALTARSVRDALGPVAVKRLTVPLGRLPRKLDGTTLVQLSDVHVGPTIGRRFVEHLVERVNAQNPDVVVITGDLVDGSVRQLRHLVAPLANLRARFGVYFVTGNHEYYSGARSWCRELEALGIRVLRNERVVIGTEDASYDLAGIDDHFAEQFGNGHGADLARALDGRNPSRELVLLAHQPRAVLDAMHAGVGLQLSGHTHGGQIWPFSYLVRLQQPVVSGLARFGDTLVYVSNGTGYWGPPMRLHAPAEITAITLRSAA